jgi:hypothetical protein
MDKTEKLIDWEENEIRDRNRNGIDDRIEPPIPDVKAGSANLEHRLQNDSLADPLITGGVVDEIRAAMGVTYADDDVLKIGEKERSRDNHRWELDPASSDDDQDRVRDEKR